MALKKKHWLLGVTIALMLVVGAAWFEPSGVVQGYLKREKTFQNRPTTYWRRGLINSDPAVQNQTLQSLEKGGSEAVPVLIEMLQTGDKGDWEAEEVRRTAAELLGRVGPEARAAVPALIATLADPDPHLGTVAALALGQIGPQTPEVCPALIGLLKTESRLSAVQALKRFGYESRAAVPNFIELLQDPEGEVRWNAAQALGNVGPEARASTRPVALAPRPLHAGRKVRGPRGFATTRPRLPGRPHPLPGDPTSQPRRGALFPNYHPGIAAAPPGP
jgi:hypothetical protein